MFTYTDYAFYRDEYHGKLTEQEYQDCVLDARMDIDNATLGRARHAPESMRENIKLCECRLVDIINTYKLTFDLLPRGLASASNNGVSATVASMSGGRDAAAAEKHERLQVCGQFLRDPVNLMYPGV